MKILKVTQDHCHMLMKIMVKKKEIIQQKSELGKMRKWSCPCVIHCHSISMQKNSEQYYQRVLHLYVPWWNESELVNSKQSYGE